MSKVSKPSAKTTGKAVVPATKGKAKVEKDEEVAGFKLVSDFETMRFNKVDVKNFDNSEFKGNGGFVRSYINYRNLSNNTMGPLAIQLPEIMLTSGGIRPLCPLDKKTQRFIKSDEDREKMSIPLEKEGPLRDFFTQIDEYFGSNEFIEANFSGRPHKYSYNPCIKIDEEKPDEPGKKPRDLTKYPLVDSVSMKFMMEGDKSTSEKPEKDRKPRRVKTELYRKEADKSLTQIDGIETITHLTEHIKWKSSVTVIFQLSDILAATTPNSKAKGVPCIYSVTLQILKVIYTPAAGTRKVNMKSVGILPDEEEEGTVEVKKPVTKKTAQILDEESEQEADADQEETYEEADGEGDGEVEDEGDVEGGDEEQDATVEEEEPEEEVIIPPKRKANASPKKSGSKRAAVEEDVVETKTKKTSGTKGKSSKTSK
jgi:hypothetical protein